MANGTEGPDLRTPEPQWSDARDLAWASPGGLDGPNGTLYFHSSADDNGNIRWRICLPSERKVAEICSYISSDDWGMIQGGTINGSGDRITVDAQSTYSLNLHADPSDCRIASVKVTAK